MLPELIKLNGRYRIKISSRVAEVKVIKIMVKKDWLGRKDKVFRVQDLQTQRVFLVKDSIKFREEIT